MKVKIVSMGKELLFPVLSKLKMPLRDIEDHLERCDARIIRAERIEAVRERNRLIALVIRTNAAIISLLCAVYAIYSQF